MSGEATSLPRMYGELKYQKLRIACYFPKQMREMYPNGDYILVGETKSNNKKEGIMDLEVHQDVLTVSRPGSHSRILYKYSGYYPVGDDEYVALLKSRVPFWLLLLPLLIMLALTVGVLIWMLARPGMEIFNPMPELDPMEEVIEEDDTEKVPAQDGGFVSMTYTLSASLNLSTGSIGMYFENPNASTHDVVLELYVVQGDREAMIAQSGRVRSGHRLSEMTFIEGSAGLSPGSYEGKYKVISYDPETGERALVESDIEDVIITVS